MTTSPATPAPRPRRLRWPTLLIVLFLLALGPLSQPQYGYSSFTGLIYVRPRVEGRHTCTFAGWPAPFYERVVVRREIGGDVLPFVVAERWSPAAMVASHAFIPAIGLAIALVWRVVRRRRFTLADLLLACVVAAVMFAVARPWLKEEPTVDCLVEDARLLEALEQDPFYRQLKPEEQAEIKTGIIQARVPAWAAAQWGATIREQPRGKRFDELFQGQP